VDQQVAVEEQLVMEFLVLQLGEMVVAAEMDMVIIAVQQRMAAEVEVLVIIVLLAFVTMVTVAVV
jgi:hypothetical protein